MARPLRIQYPGALYHIFNRGNEKKAIFRDDADRRELLKILSRSTETYDATLFAFVLMSNHWHLLVQTPLGNLSEFMRHFNITYTSHYNRRHSRVGNLYQGRYKSILVESDAYLNQVSRYIHLNPVKVAGMRTKPIEKQLSFLRGYRWSSLPGYLNKSKRLDFIDYCTVLGEYSGDTPSGRRRYGNQLAEDLAGRELDFKDKIVGQSILGSDGFVSWVHDTFLDSNNDREQPGVRLIRQYASRAEVLSVVAEETGREDISSSTGTTRQMLMTALYTHAGLNNREIGELLGVDYSTVSQGRKRLRGKTRKDKEVRRTMERIEARLSRIKI